MSLNWLYFSDTNAPAGEIETYLNEMKWTLKSISKVEELHPHLMEGERNVLFIKANSLFNVYELCQELSVIYPHVYIIMIVPDNMENMRKAMHVGAFDLLRLSSTSEEVREAILQAKKYMDRRSSKENLYSSNLVKQESRVISICSPRGGIGRTSLTVNLAVAFAKQGKKVAVIDGDLQFGDVAMYFNLKPNRTIYEWVKEAYGRSNFSIDQYMVKHDSGVYILAAPPRPEFFEVVEEVHIKTAIEEARKIFDVILIDTSAYLSEIHLNLLEEADDLLLMTKNDLSALRINKLYLDTLESMNLKGKVKLVLNTSKESKKMQLEPKKIEEILGINIHATLPEQTSITASSIAVGQPFVITHPRSALSKSVWNLLSSLEEKEENISKRQRKGKMLTKA